jgi:hypothetical protein
MRKNRKFYLAVALTLGLITAISSVSGQEFGAIFDPDPEIPGYFMYTLNDWMFMGPVATERHHLLAAAYGDNTPESLRRHCECDLLVNTESN